MGEERKYQHINELLINHQIAFDAIEAYYNDITHDNHQLIKSLQDETTEKKLNEKSNQKKMRDLMHENKELSEPLQKKREEQRELKDKLRYRRFQKAAWDLLRKAELGKYADLEKKLEAIGEDEVAAWID